MICLLCEETLSLHCRNCIVSLEEYFRSHRNITGKKLLTAATVNVTSLLSTSTGVSSASPRSLLKLVIPSTSVEATPPSLRGCPELAAH